MAKKTDKPERRPCCGVPVKMPYKPLGCAVCNPGFWLPRRPVENPERETPSADVDRYADIGGTDW